MTKKWYSILDSVKFSIAILLIGALFTGIGNIPTTNALLQKSFEILSFLGKEIKEIFPIAVVINYIGKTHKDFTAVIGAIICYVVFHVVTMFAASPHFNSAYYYSVLGIQSGNLKPLNLGVIASVIIIMIILYSYRVSRKRFNYGFLHFIDNDVWFLLVAFVLTVLSALIVCGFAPRLIAFFQRGLLFISKNNTNPALLFVYGCVDKVLELFGIDNITKQQFLFDSLGGNWINANEVNIFGDVNIWTAQSEAGTIGKAVGKFITPSYIVNVFIVPSLIIAYFFNINDKMDRKRMAGTVIVGIITSLLTASSLPLEYVLLFTAPLLLSIHILLTGSIYMILAMNSIYLGYQYSGPLSSMCMGNVLDLIGFVNNVNLHQMAMKVIFVGIIFFVLYQVITIVYYRLMSFDFLEPELSKVEIREIIQALGGLDNIKMINSSVLSIIVVLYDKEKIKVDQLVDNKAYKVRERYFGYIISFGPASSQICHRIRKEVKNYEDCLKYSVK